MILKLDFASAVPVYRQIRNQIVLGIAEGELKPGARLPSVRALADEAGVNMMTVDKAYQILKQEGYISADRRKGAVVCGETRRELSDQTLAELKLIISTARLNGMEKDELISLCSALYDQCRLN